MDYLEFLKIEYIVIVISMYIFIVTYYVIVKKRPIFRKYNNNIAGVFYAFIIARDIAFRSLKNYYEDEMYREIGISTFDIKVPIVCVCVAFTVVAIIIINDVIKLKNTTQHSFLIYNDNEEVFKETLHSLKARGVKVFDEKIVNKKKSINFKITFYDITYKEAFSYTNEFSNGVEPKSHLVRNVLFFSIFLILDISLQIYRINSDYYISVFEYVKNLF